MFLSLPLSLGLSLMFDLLHHQAIRDPKSASCRRFIDLLVDASRFDLVALNLLTHRFEAAQQLQQQLPHDAQQLKDIDVAVAAVRSPLGSEFSDRNECANADATIDFDQFYSSLFALFPSTPPRTLLPLLPCTVSGGPNSVSLPTVDSLPATVIAVATHSTPVAATSSPNGCSWIVPYLLRAKHTFARCVCDHIRKTAPFDLRNAVDLAAAYIFDDNNDNEDSDE